MELNIKINLDNAAFQGDDDNSEYGSTYSELKDMFTSILNNIGTPEVGEYGNLRDSNGNTVGEWSIKE